MIPQPHYAPMTTEENHMTYLDENHTLVIDGSENIAELRRLAEQGHVGAQYVLAVRYDNGEEGVPQNYPEAIKWYRKAAEQGDSEAQHDLGMLYHKLQDHYESYIWFSIYIAGLKGGIVEGIDEVERRADAMKHLAPTQLSAAQQEATLRFNAIQRRQAAK